jgi:hypothetical protein
MKRAHLSIAALLVLAAPLAGCGNRQDAAADKAAPGVDATSAAPAGQTQPGKGAPISAAPDAGLNPGYSGNGGVGSKAGGR